MKTKIISGIYWIIGSVHILAGFLDMQDLHDMSKALLMPILVYLLFVVADGVITLPRLLIAAALIFSWGGDILLIKKGEEIYFLAGLSSFLIAQLLYSFIMFKSTFSKPTIKIKPIIPVIIYGIVLLGSIVPNVGSLAIPIIVYSGCILMMVSSSILRNKLTSDESFQWAMYGAILFILSDSMIAINKFVIEIPLAEALIMITYITAQYLIVRGILKHPGG